MRGWRWYLVIYFLLWWMAWKLARRILQWLSDWSSLASRGTGHSSLRLGGCKGTSGELLNGDNLPCNQRGFVIFAWLGMISFHSWMLAMLPDSKKQWAALLFLDFAWHNVLCCLKVFPNCIPIPIWLPNQGFVSLGNYVTLDCGSSCWTAFQTLDLATGYFPQLAFRCWPIFCFLSSGGPTAILEYLHGNLCWNTIQDYDSTLVAILQGEEGCFFWSLGCMFCSLPWRILKACYILYVVPKNDQCENCHHT